MARADKLLADMRANPRDWRIEEIITLCQGFGIDCSAPRKGSHDKVKHRDMPQILTIPAHRPIKPIYVRELVRFVDVLQGGSS
jgi:predicted RNA binding protein YcfA (HicA-like mRNA interferase family)